MIDISTIERDFDRLARLDSEGWTPNNHYHDFLLRYVPTRCSHALEIGCGTGAFSRYLAERAESVLAIDLSSEMIRVAKSRSAQSPNLEFQVVEAMDFLDAGSESTSERFDCIVSIATLHHLSQREILGRMKNALAAGGVLMVLDLFEPEHSLLKLEGWRDFVLNATACAVSVSLRLIHNGRLLPPRAVRAAWEKHGRADHYRTMTEVHNLCAEILPGARVRRHLLWRYSIVWVKQPQRP